MEPLLYVFFMAAHELGGLSRLNGYPLVRGYPGHAHNQQIRVNDLLIEGNNVFSIELSRSEERPYQRMDAWLKRGRFSADEEGFVLFEQRFRPIDGLPADGTPHEVLRHELRLDRAFGRWSWQDARPWRDDDRTAMLAIHRAVGEALVQRDVARLLELFSIKYAELDRSIERAPDPTLSKQAAEWKKVLADPSARVVIAPESELVATSWSDGRLVQIMQKDGEPPAKVVLGDLRLSVPYVVSVLPDGLRIVR